MNKLQSEKKRKARRAKLLKLMDQLKGTQAERIAKTAEIVVASQSTVRAWMCNSLNRVPTDATLVILEREISRGVR